MLQESQLQCKLFMLLILIPEWNTAFSDEGSLTMLHILFLTILLDLATVMMGAVSIILFVLT